MEVRSTYFRRVGPTEMHNQYYTSTYSRSSDCWLRDRGRTALLVNQEQLGRGNVCCRVLQAGQKCKQHVRSGYHTILPRSVWRILSGERFRLRETARLWGFRRWSCGGPNRALYILTFKYKIVPSKLYMSEIIDVRILRIVTLFSIRLHYVPFNVLLDNRHV